MVKINGEEKEIAGKNLLEFLKETGFEPERMRRKLIRKQSGRSLIQIIREQETSISMGISAL